MRSDLGWNPFYACVLFARQLDLAVRKRNRSLESFSHPALSHNRCNYEREIYPSIKELSSTLLCDVSRILAEIFLRFTKLI